MTTGTTASGTYYYFNKKAQEVPIDVKVGYQLVYNPKREKLLSADHLIGATINRLYFHLTDQSGASVDTATEDWSVSVTIKYVLAT